MPGWSILPHVTGRSILIIGSDEQWEERRLAEAARAAGHEASYLPAASLLLTLDAHDADVLFEGRSVRDRLKDGVIVFRRTRGARQTMAALAALARDWGVPATDSPWSIASNLDKSLSLPTVALKHIRHVPSIFLPADRARAPADIALPFPLLAKPVFGRHGEGIEMLPDPPSLEIFLARPREEGYIVQRRLPLEAEYRVFVVGKRSLGVIRKIPAEGSLVANYAAGARFEPDELPADVIDEATAVCGHQEIDIGGVDIALSDGQYYLLEVNRCPEFRAFEGATGAGVAEAIVDFVSGL